MTTRVSLREKHAVETRERILAEALALFVAQGFDATTVDEIAQRADVSPRTFFRYFPSKEALLFHDFEERLTQVRDLIERRPAGEPPGLSLVEVLGAMVSDLDSTPEVRSLMVQLHRERRSMRDYQRAALVVHTEQEVTAALARRAGVTPDDLGIRAMVGAITACFDIALRDWVDGDTREPFPELFRRTIAACAAAFPAGATFVP